MKTRTAESRVKKKNFPASMLFFLCTCRALRRFANYKRKTAGQRNRTNEREWSLLILWPALGGTRCNCLSRDYPWRVLAHRAPHLSTALHQFSSGAMFHIRCARMPIPMCMRANRMPRELVSLVFPRISN